MNTSEKEYCYYWYHHMAIPSEECQKIDKIILDHDWEAFMKYFKEYNNRYYTYKGKKHKLTYFPDVISVHDDEDNYENDDDYIENGITDIPLNEENFKLITFAEHECG